MKKKERVRAAAMRQMWTLKPITRVKANKKGKGSYDRQSWKREA